MDRDYWTRVLFDLHDRNTEDDPCLTRAEWVTVQDFTAIHKRETGGQP